MSEHTLHTTIASAATEVAFDAGMHITAAAEKLVEVAHHVGSAIGSFNEISLRADTTSTVADIVADYDRLCSERVAAYRASPEGIAAAQRANARRQELQSIHDALMAELPTLFTKGQVAIVDWLCAMQAPTDYIGVIIRKDTIAAAFAKHNYVPGMDCGADFKPNVQASVFRYLVGQGLDGIVNGPAIHGIIHKLAAEWKEKFKIDEAQP